jgi:hypothetical protein
MRDLGTFRNVVSSEMLDEVFKRYRNAITGLISSESDSPYTLPLAESEDYENIFTFVQNAVIKDQNLIKGVQANGGDVNEFSKKLMKYFQNSLSESDILDLREFVLNYNKSVADKLYSSAYSYIYGIGSDITLEESFYQRVVILVKQRIELFIQEFLRKNDANRELSKSVNEWYGISDNIAEVLPTSQPENPAIGDRWFDEGNNILYTAVTKIIIISDEDIPTEEPEDSSAGDMWFDEDTDTLYTATQDGTWEDAEEDVLEVAPIEDPEEGDRWFNEDEDTLYTTTAEGTWENANEEEIETKELSAPANGLKWFDETTDTLYTYIVNEWYGDDDTPLSSQRSGRAVNLNEFYTSYFLKGNLIESLIAITIVFYLNNSLKSINNSFTNLTDIENSTGNPINLENEITFIQPSNNSVQKEYNFSDTTKFIISEIITSNLAFIYTDVIDPNKKYYKKVVTYTLVPNNNANFLSIPLYSKVIQGFSYDNGENLQGIEEYISEIYNMVQLDDANSISFDSLFKSLYSNLYGFLNNIDYRNNSVNPDYLQALSYFYNGNDERSVFLLSINNDVRSASQMYYLKDFIQQSYYFSTEESEKKSASINQQSATEKGEHLTFIDLKGISFSEDNLVRARDLFTNTDRDYSGAVGNILGDTDGDENTGNISKLTYVLLYKELIPVYRYYILGEIQEFIFARMIQQIGKNNLFLTGTETDTFSTSANAIYRSYKEKELSPFVLYDAYSTYKLYYNNIVKSRSAEDSEIIGYFIGDNTPLSEFTRKYGSKKYQKEEIYNFLNIYKSTRDYFYKVLRNNSFIFDDAHSLYEKLFISFTAIERFLNSKIDNIHNLDYYSSKDIENFLESYGLGILNQFKFLIDGEDYKINIIKNFAELTRKKGSKDVIDTLLRVFRLQDREIDINKFLLVDKTEVESFTTNNNIILKLNEADRLTVNGTAPFEVNIADIDTNVSYKDITVRKLLEEVLDEFDPKNIYITINGSNKYIDPRENIKDYFTQKISLILNDNPDAPTANTALLTYKKNISLFNRVVSVNSTFGNIISDFNIIPSNDGYNLYDIDEEGLTDGIIEKSSSLTLEPEIITINIILIDSVFYAQYNGIRTKIFKINGTSKSFGEILNDLDIVQVNNDEYNYSLQYEPEVDDSILSSPINAGLLFTSNVELINDRNVDITLKKRDIWVVYNNEFNITVKTDIKFKSDNEEQPFNSLNFVEVSYESENGSREIFNNLRSGVAYSSFIAPDPYWDESEVTQSQLLTMNVNAVETKYLSLALRDNTYKKFAIARYLISAIEHLESKLDINGVPILNNTLLDSGDGLFGEISIGDYFKTIKTLFKSIIRLYESKIGNDIVSGILTEKEILSVGEPEDPQEGDMWFDKDEDTLYTAAQDGTWEEEELDAVPIKNPEVGYRWFDKDKNTLYTVIDDAEDRLFYGINNITSDTAWTELISYLKSILVKAPEDTDAYESFLTLQKKFDLDEEDLIPPVYSNIPFFNLYERVPIDSGWLNYTSQGGDNDLHISFREIVKDASGLPKLNSIGNQLRYSLFTSHKTASGRNLIQSYRDSGDYVIQAIENLNYIRSTESNEIWLNFLSNYFDGRAITDNNIFIPQLSNRTINTSELYEKIISSMLMLPIDIFDGLLTSQIEPNIYHSPKFVELMEKIFNAGYLTKTDPLAVNVENLPASVKNIIPDAIEYLNSINIEDPNEFDIEITSLTETLVSLINNMKLLFNSQEYVDFAFSLKSEETQTLDFLTTSISLLLSYTTELYQIEFKRVYDTPSESFPITDDAFHTLRNKRIETVFYDDKLTIERIE